MSAAAPSGRRATERGGGDRSEGKMGKKKEKLRLNGQGRRREWGPTAHDPCAPSGHTSAALRGDQAGAGGAVGAHLLPFSLPFKPWFKTKAISDANRAPSGTVSLEKYIYINISGIAHLVLFLRHQQVIPGQTQELGASRTEPTEPAPGG